MKIVAISHACVVDLNQNVFVALRSIPSVEVELIVPAFWKSEYTGQRHPPLIHPDVDFPVHALPIRLAGHVWLHYYRRGLSEAIRRAAPDVVFLDQEPWSVVAAQVTSICRRLGVPWVCYTKQNVNKRYPFPFRWIERQTHETAAGIVALTQEAESVLRAKGFSGPCSVLPHGYDKVLFRPGMQEQRRRELGLRGTVIGYMGRFVSIKGLRTLVDAVQQLLVVLPDADIKVLMVGSGPMGRELKARVAQYGLEDRFVFTGPVTHREAPQYLQCMDIFVLPSITQSRAKEQFGRVVIEAMACGVPVVGSSSGNIPFLIRESGGGEIFPEGDAYSLAAVLRGLIADPELRSQLGRTGALNVRKNFSYRAIAAKLHQVLLSSCDHLEEESAAATELLDTPAPSEPAKPWPCNAEPEVR